ncbi:hypothetical protein CRG98_021502 [Punica granatum]|uniref:Uncharacterized protein n=1 Tax=Punica granatum TaxID=22663 RepID=A0A2I0JQE0_PUNGR|nr:hypothetical protein CRG98_021502 [Punica granatum]
MLQYWDYEEFFIHTFQDSLAGATLDWYMSLKAADISTWADLSSKFIYQYKYCVETPPTLLELSTMEMTEGQGFEAYVVKWRVRAVKHVPPISEAQQIQLFHYTLRGAYYLHLLAHTSPFSNLIDAGKKLDMGVKLGKREGPTEKKERESSKKATTGTPSAGNRRGRDAYKLRERIQQMVDDKQLTFNAVKPPNVQAIPLPDHGSSSGPSINMNSVCAIGVYETEQEASTPFVIEYVPAETVVGYAGFDSTPAPFGIEVLVREPYQDSKVPWTYEESVGNLKHQFSVMDVTCLGRVYKNPKTANKGKVPAATLGIASEATPIPQKMVTEEEDEKMCCALVWVIQRFQQYSLYHTIRLLSKADPLKYLLGNVSSTRNIAKWHCQLTEYDIEFVPRTSVKGQAIADHLAEFPIEDDTPINSDFPDEGILQVDEEEDGTAWKMYFDGAVNSTGSGIGAVLISPDGRYYLIAVKVDFPYTNNVAEYEACVLGLQAAIDFRVKELEVFGDLMLTIFQTLGQWKTKDAKLIPYHEYLEELAENFEKISFTYTPRIKNQFVDALATLASMVGITKETSSNYLRSRLPKVRLTATQSRRPMSHGTKTSNIFCKPANTRHLPTIGTGKHFDDSRHITS